VRRHIADQLARDLNREVTMNRKLVAATLVVAGAWTRAVFAQDS
jgi:hypothetical protein